MIVIAIIVMRLFLIISQSQIQAGNMDGTEEIETAIREQIEFYFSAANLATDRSMRKQIANGSWVHASYLLACRKIKELFQKLNVQLKYRKSRLSQIMRESVLVKVSHGRFKRKQKFKPQLESKKLLYIEFPLQHETQIRSQLDKFSSQHSIKITTKDHTRWMFISPTHKEAQLEAFLRAHGKDMGITVVYNGEELEKWQGRYEEILRAMGRTRKEEIRDRVGNRNIMECK